MKKRTRKIEYFLPLLFFLLLVDIQAQNLTLTELGSLPAVLRESSGLQFGGQGRLWSHADDGTGPILYSINRQGALTGSIYIKNAGQFDWEDLTRDDAGNFYIGEFGNNANNRTDLKIYKIPDPDAVTGDSVEAEVISFTYEDQTAFPPPVNGLHYDLEAMVWFEDSIYLFTKNRSDPFDGYTYLYRLPDAPGSYQAEKLDSLYLGPGPKELWWVTSADLSPDGRQLVLLSSDKLWLLSCFEGADFFGGALRRLGAGTISQKEGVAFAGNDTLYITDEQVFIIGGKLYRSLLGPYANGLYVDLGPDQVVSEDSVLLDAGLGGVQYLWSTGDTTRQVVLRQGGAYWLEVSLNGCLDRDTVQVDFSSTSVSPAQERQDTGLQVSISPNPFGLSTDIQCFLPQAGDVILEVYDLQGKKVAHLAYRYLQAGAQTFRLSRQNVDFGPGSYLLVISSNGRKAEKRLVRY